jgi:hypothetical protein
MPQKISTTIGTRSGIKRQDQNTTDPSQMLGSYSSRRNSHFQ